MGEKLVLLTVSYLRVFSAGDGRSVGRKRGGGRKRDKEGEIEGPLCRCCPRGAVGSIREGDREKEKEESRMREKRMRRSM